MQPLRHLILFALLGSAPALRAALPADPVVLTLDGRHYVTYAVPVSFFPGDRLLLAPEALMRNCRRSAGGATLPGTYTLVYSPMGSEVQATSITLNFGPTRFVLETASGDVVCDNEAMGWQSGIDRIFRGHFESP